MITPKRAQELLTTWFAQRETQNVALSERTPTHDPYEDYRVEYEVAFEPRTLDYSFVEVWVTSDGDIAIGFERRERLAQRIGVKNRMRWFAGGHEPVNVSEPGLLAILDMIADGNMALKPMILPIMGLTSLETLVPTGTIRILAERGYSPHHWMKEVSGEALHRIRNVITFKPW